MQVNRQGVLPSKPKIFQRDLGSKQKRHKGCVHVAASFLWRLELLPSSPGSGISALKKGTLKKRFSKEPGTGNSHSAGKASLLWERRESKPRCVCQPPFEARGSLIQQETSRSAQRTEVLVTGP